MFRLNEAGSVRVTPLGLFYGPVRLVAKTADGFEPRAPKVLMKRLAPGVVPSASGLRAVADALTRG